MEFTGRDHVKFYDESYNPRQTPLPGPRKWQDSTWLQWWDEGSKTGGVHRIGHEYNLPEGPMVSGWTTLITPRGVFKHMSFLPLREEDKLPLGWGDGAGICRNEVVGDEHVWIVENPDPRIAAELRFRDFHQAFCGFPSAGKTAEEISADHIDVAGSVTGWIEMEGERFQVDGLGLRDHGWGYRDVNLILSHRYVTGCFGEDLSFCAYSVCNASNDKIEQFGWVVRDGAAHFARKIDMIAYVENDSTSTRGGLIEMTLADGAAFRCELQAAAPGITSKVHNMFNTNTLCVARSDGRVGSGMLETSINFYQGSREPAKMVGNLFQPGFYPGAASRGAGGPDGPYMEIRTI